MRRKYFATSSSVRAALLDASIAAVSVFLALAIRANFQDFLVQIVDVAVLGTFIVLTRAGTMTFFEHYSYSRTVWQTRDIASLLVHNLLPTFVLVLLRLFSPIRALRFPLSVIVLEYAMSVLMMIVARSMEQGRAVKRGAVPIHRPRVVLYGEVQDLRSADAITRVTDDGKFVIRAVLSPNPMHWDTDLTGVRVVGDERALPDLLLADDSISHLLIVKPEFVPAARRKEIEVQATACRVAVQELNLSDPDQRLV